MAWAARSHVTDYTPGDVFRDGTVWGSRPGQPKEGKERMAQCQKEETPLEHGKEWERVAKARQGLATTAVNPGILPGTARKGASLEAKVQERGSRSQRQ